jgi:hypothetical protein
MAPAMRPVRGGNRDAGVPESSKITLYCADSRTESGRDNRSRNRLGRRAEELDKSLLPLHSTQSEVAITRDCRRRTRLRTYDLRRRRHADEDISNSAAGLAALMNSVETMTPSVAQPEPITAFFARYTGYLTAGDLDGLASIYNYPALAVTAAGCLAVIEPQQTRDFFAQGQTFYRSHNIQGVRACDIVTDVEVPGIWVGRLVLENLDSEGNPVGHERNAYQLVTTADGTRRIAVTTPLDAYQPDQQSGIPTSAL